MVWHYTWTFVHSSILKITCMENISSSARSWNFAERNQNSEGLNNSSNNLATLARWLILGRETGIIPTKTETGIIPTKTDGGVAEIKATLPYWGGEECDKIDQIYLKHKIWRHLGRQMRVSVWVRTCTVLTCTVLYCTVHWPEVLDVVVEDVSVPLTRLGPPEAGGVGQHVGPLLLPPSRPGHQVEVPGVPARNISVMKYFCNIKKYFCDIDTAILRNIPMD